MDNHAIESKRGFLVPMGQTYPALRPYFKGVHATLESWRSGCDENGWQVKPPQGEAEVSSPANPSSNKRKAGTSAKAKFHTRKRKKRNNVILTVAPL